MLAVLRSRQYPQTTTSKTYHYSINRYHFKSNIMYTSSSVFALAFLTTTALAQPTTSPYTWSVTNFTDNASAVPGQVNYAFSISGPSTTTSGQATPAFNANCFGISGKDYASCFPINGGIPERASVASKFLVLEPYELSVRYIYSAGGTEQTTFEAVQQEGFYPDVQYNFTMTPGPAQMDA